jgi:hypothetical protein
MSDALLHAQTENRRNTPKKYLSVFFMKASLKFIKDKTPFGGNIYFFGDVELSPKKTLAFLCSFAYIYSEQRCN